MQVKKQQVEPDMEQQTDPKLGKKYVKAVYCHPAYLTYVQSTSCKMPGWMKHKLESRLLGEISITSHTQMTPSLWQKAKEFQKNIYFCYIDYAKAFDCRKAFDKLSKILKEMEIPDYLT